MESQEAQIYIEIGKILAARSAVLHIKKKFKENYAGAGTELKQAKDDLNRFKNNLAFLFIHVELRDCKNVL